MQVPIVRATQATVRRTSLFERIPRQPAWACQFRDVLHVYPAHVQLDWSRHRSLVLHAISQRNRGLWHPVWTEMVRAIVRCGIRTSELLDENISVTVLVCTAVANKTCTRERPQGRIQRRVSNKRVSKTCYRRLTTNLGNFVVIAITALGEGLSAETPVQCRRHL